MKHIKYISRSLSVELYVFYDSTRAVLTQTVFAAMWNENQLNVHAGLIFSL